MDLQGEVVKVVEIQQVVVSKGGDVDKKGRKSASGASVVRRARVESAKGQKHAQSVWITMGKKWRTEFFKLEDPVDVYVNVQILNIPSIDSADCRVSLKLNVSAFWRDPRMEDMWYVFLQACTALLPAAL